MSIKIALVGNPNSGKTTLFNALTGSNQYVGNWPGVTVEKKEGKLKKNKEAILTDLPGIYSLSPYTPEEIIARNYLILEKPNAIINVVDGTNLERNLYLTTQLLELGVPVVVAINMMDIVRKSGDTINIEGLSKELGCQVIEISALKNKGINEVADVAVKIAAEKASAKVNMLSSKVESAICEIEALVKDNEHNDFPRWNAVKLFERDDKVISALCLNGDTLDKIEGIVAGIEKDLDDDCESIITNDRYNYITGITRKLYVKVSKESISEKIDKIVTNKFLALPIFVVVMFLVYTISIGTVGDFTVTFMNDGLFGSFAETYPDSFLSSWLSIPELLDMVLLNGEGTPIIAEWLYSLIMDGIVGGVGAVLGFVPQMLILFLLLSLLEDCGYMSRVAFIMDRLFRKLGLSGKSFIPMLVASGCGVPGIMASRTIDQDRDRKMTIMTTGFIPCGAKMPIVGLIASALFGGSAWIATSAYFVGIGAVIISGIILKKTKAFRGEPAPFVMELPSYHAPVAGNIFRTTWDRGWGFIKRAGTVILLASIIIWTLNSLSFDGGFHYITEDLGGRSLLELLGTGVAFLFIPLGFGSWQAAVATILGLVAKEEVVGVFGTLANMSDLMGEIESGVSVGAQIVGQTFFGGSKLAGFSFLIFNLLCAPCFAAMGAIKREMNNWKWTLASIGYMTGFAYVISLIVYQIGMLFTGVFTFGTVVAFVALGVLLYLLFRKDGFSLIDLFKKKFKKDDISK
ncbi:MAG: ferrous iron transport protein B [Clostridia bacterium]|nr:ferrous iron transport protein B [Clostridia bacterium]